MSNRRADFRDEAGQNEYQPPKLTVYGRAVHLTASGTSSTGEGMGGGNSKKP